LGGVFIALEGLKKYLNQNQEKDLNQNDNLTPIQKFFISYARIWRCNIRDEEMKKRLMIDPHSPTELRVNGILNNVDDFYTAFNVGENNKLYLEKSLRAKIW
jgi:predicted metalloendopeptidase